MGKKIVAINGKSYVSELGLIIVQKIASENSEYLKSVGFRPGTIALAKMAVEGSNEKLKKAKGPKLPFWEKD